jgi:hypothetical protein
MIQRNPKADVPKRETLALVARLLEEALETPAQPWRFVCKRISETTQMSVTLVDSEGHEPHGNTRIRSAMYDEGYFVRISAIGPNDDWTEKLTLADIRELASSSAKSGMDEHRTRSHTRQTAPVSPVFNEAYLIREFDRRERERGPIFAGFIVNDLLPRLGFDTADAKRILRAMEAQDIVRMERKPNPKDPDRSTTFVRLNRDHPHVARVLEGAKGSARKFPVCSIEGEPLSETIIRERM